VSKSTRLKAQIWLYWKRTLQSYLRIIEDVTDEVKLDILVSLLDTSVYMYIADCPTFEAAIARLDEVYVKPINEVFARHKLSTCCQEMGESLEELFQRLKKLSADCNFTAVSAVQSRNASGMRLWPGFVLTSGKDF